MGGRDGGGDGGEGRGGMGGREGRDTKYHYLNNLPYIHSFSAEYILLCQNTFPYFSMNLLQPWNEKTSE